MINPYRYSKATVTQTSSQKSSFVQLLLVDLVDTAQPVFRVSSTDIKRDSQYCALIRDNSGSSTIKQRIPCVFPFMWDGVQHSSCTKGFHWSQFCSTVFQQRNETSIAGECVQCDSAANELGWSVQASPVASIVRLAGNLESIARHVENFVYIPGADSYLQRSTWSGGTGTDSAATATDLVIAAVYDDRVRLDLDLDSNSNSNIHPSAVELPVQVVMNNEPVTISGPDGSGMYAYEDVLTFVPGLAISGGNYPLVQGLQGLSQFNGQVSVSMQVDHGDIFMLDHSGVTFGLNNVTGNLTFFGSVSDVNTALSSLVYSPEVDYHSAKYGSSDNTDTTPTTYRLTMSSASEDSVQLITTTVPDMRGSVDASTMFRVNLSCLSYGRSLMAYLNETEHNVTAASGAILATASASDVQTALQAMVAECNAQLKNAVLFDST